ncbi:amino acid dehydrogenase [Nitrincola sp. A-D6]|uniref:NAD(P)/FAD-dependent oxidoreductase n=1 Tax=Nitrincola sp. A-D6 TaxID=1545442 RepID=UPI00051FD3B7|nr:FAD-dependent oxidoreductase [Nitrincola sp. A-D6]KGK42317.1 amino acid dehydrogenase [Nitrincola sp. A-D6]
MAKQDANIIVIGAGVIGLSCALALQRAGFRVQVLDRTGVAAEASQGNAGAFAFTEVEPLATPGIMRKAPRWLLDPLGPLSLPLGYAVQFAPWMLRFWRASWRDRYEQSTRAQTSLMQLSKSCLEELIASIQAEEMIRREGQLQLYEGEADFNANQESLKLKQAQGIEVQILKGADAIASIQPGLSERFTHAAYTPAWMNVCNPASWVERLAQHFQEAGGEITIATVNAIQPESASVTLNTDQGTQTASKVILACGAWSRTLAQSIGDRLPLDTERGYNTTLPAGAFDLKTHLTFPAHGFVVSRIDEGVRVGGAVEFGGLQRPPNYKRAQTLLNKAKRFLPGLNTADGVQWMGFRPSMPDSLPVISHASQSDRVIYCFGHGHLGLTQSAGSAQLVKDLVLGEASSIDRAPFSAKRFH